LSTMARHQSMLDTLTAEVFEDGEIPTGTYTSAELQLTWALIKASTAPYADIDTLLHSQGLLKNREGTYYGLDVLGAFIDSTPPGSPVKEYILSQQQANLSAVAPGKVLVGDGKYVGEVRENTRTGERIIVNKERWALPLVNLQSDDSNELRGQAFA